MREDEIHSAMSVLRQATNPLKKQRAVTDRTSERDPFRILISAMLSLHIRDAVLAEEASERLLALADTPQALVCLPVPRIREAISPIDSSRPRAHHILETCKFLVERYDGRVPDSRTELMALPGIGPKTASFIVIQAYQKPAICVDMHVHRITNRWGYVSTKSPEKTETVLRAKLPRDYWLELGEELTALGDHYCFPQLPNCLTCPVKAYCDRVGVMRSQ